MAEESDALDTLFAALANRHRREIIYALALQPHSITQLADLRGLSLPAIHKHIVVLEDAGMVVRRKSGRTTFLALDRQSLRALQYWLSEFHAYWGTGAETLENYEQYLSKGQPTSPEE